MELNVKALSPKIGTEIPAPFYASAGAAAHQGAHQHAGCGGEGEGKQGPFEAFGLLAHGINFRPCQPQSIFHHITV